MKPQQPNTWILHTSQNVFISSLKINQTTKIQWKPNKKKSVTKKQFFFFLIYTLFYNEMVKITATSDELVHTVRIYILNWQVGEKKEIITEALTSEATRRVCERIKTSSSVASVKRISAAAASRSLSLQN